MKTSKSLSSTAKNSIHGLSLIILTIALFTVSCKKENIEPALPETSSTTDKQIKKATFEQVPFQTSYSTEKQIIKKEVIHTVPFQTSSPTEKQIIKKKIIHTVPFQTSSPTEKQIIKRKLFIKFHSRLHLQQKNK